MTVAVDMVEVSAAGIRVSGGAVEVSCVAAKGAASAAICSSSADTKSAGKPHLGGGTVRWMSSWSMHAVVVAVASSAAGRFSSGTAVSGWHATLRISVTTV
jgi:hypothetical protein